MRRNIRGHADRDPGRTVEQQVGQAGGQDERLLERAIEVIAKIDRIFVDVGQHFLGHPAQAGLGIALSRRRIAVHRAKVALPVDKRVAHGEILRQAGHGIVHCHIAVRVVLAQHFADDAGGFFIRGVRPDAHIVHGVEDAAVNWLETIARVRKGPGNDHAHGIVEVSRTHLLVEIDLFYGTDIHTLILHIFRGNLSIIPQRREIWLF